MPPIEMPQTAQITAVGKTVTITSNTATSPTLVPLNSNGTNPKVVRVVADGRAHIKFGASTSALNSATMNDIMILGSAGADFFNVIGAPFFTVCLDSASASTTVLNITAVETG